MSKPKIVSVKSRTREEGGKVIVTVTTEVEMTLNPLAMIAKHVGGSELDLDDPGFWEDEEEDEEEDEPVSLQSVRQKRALIARIVEALGMTFKDFFEALGVNRGTVYEWRKKDSIPSDYQTQRGIAKMLRSVIDSEGDEEDEAKKALVDLYNEFCTRVLRLTEKSHSDEAIRERVVREFPLYQLTAP